jgi:hypothetical protein
MVSGRVLQGIGWCCRRDEEARSTAAAVAVVTVEAVVIVVAVVAVVVELTMFVAPCHVRFWKSPTSSHTAEGVCYAHPSASASEYRVPRFDRVVALRSRGSLAHSRQCESR